jgi:hypothetical protein
MNEESTSRDAKKVADEDQHAVMSATCAAIRGQRFASYLTHCLANDGWLTEGAMLGFPCFHLYEHDDLPENEEALSNQVCTTDIQLRGADSVLAITAARLGFQVNIVR